MENNDAEINNPNRLLLEEINARLIRIENANEKQRKQKSVIRGIILAGLVVGGMAALGRSKTVNANLESKNSFGANTLQTIYTGTSDMINQIYDDTIIDKAIDDAAHTIDNINENVFNMESNEEPKGMSR